MIHNIFTLDIHVFIIGHHDLHEISSWLTMKKNDTVNIIISMRIFQLNSPPNKTLRLPLRPLAGICSSSWRRRSSRADGLAKWDDFPQKSWVKPPPSFCTHGWYYESLVQKPTTKKKRCESLMNWIMFVWTISWSLLCRNNPGKKAT